MSEPRSFMALDWVKDELENTLGRAREALEAHAEQPGDPTLARHCLTSLHEVNGTLQMVQLMGGAALAGEMEALAQALMNRSVENDERAQEALMEGILQLPTYLSRVHRGAPDDPRVHAPLINRMRVVRGEKPLAQPDAPAVADSTAIADFLKGSGHAEVLKVRTACHKAMAALLRGKQPADKIYRFFDKAYARLEELVPVPALQRLWGAAAGAMEVSRIAGTDPKSLLPLLSGLDRQLKSLAQATEATLAAPPPASLFDGLKAIVDSSKQTSPRLAALRERLAKTAEVQQEAPALGADEETIAMVAVELHKELGQIRDRLDLFVRGGAPDAEALTTLGAELQRAAATLQVTGLNELCELISRQAEWLQSQTDVSSVNEESVMEVASAVIQADSELMRLAGMATDSADMSGSLSDAQMAVLREARASFEVAKQAIVEFIATDSEHSHLEAVPGELDSVCRVLGLVPLEQASKLVDQLSRYVDEEILKPRLVPESQQLDKLADAISSIDYYLERLIEDRVAPEPKLLVIAEESIGELKLADTGQAASGQSEMKPEAVKPKVAGDLAEPLAPTEIFQAVERPKETKSKAAKTKKEAPVPEAEDDDGIKEVFLEEVAEVLRTLDEALPKFRAHPNDGALLTEVRRAYHTLKGSGRMVGASAIGELALSVENMLNNVIDGTIMVSPQILDVTEKAKGLLPELSAAFAEEREPNVKVEPWVERADLLASGCGDEELEPPSVADTATASDSASEPVGASLSDEPSALTSPVEGDFALDEELELAPAVEPEEEPLIASGADDEPSALTSPVEGDFALDEELELAPAVEPEEEPLIASGADDEPSALTSPVEGDFALDEELELAPAVEPEGEPLIASVADDEPSALTSPVEGDFALDEELELAPAVEPEEEPLRASGADDEPSALTSPVEDDFALDEELELAPAVEPEEEPLRASGADDEPSALTSPVEGDFALDEELELAPAVEPEEEPLRAFVADEPPAPPSPVKGGVALDDEPVLSAQPAVAQVGEPATTAEDEGLLEIFAEEAEEHFVVVRAFLEKAQAQGGSAPLSEALRRALHTLHGSATMAEFPGISALVVPLEKLVKIHLELARDTDAVFVGVVDKGLSRLEAALEGLCESEAERPFVSADQDYLDEAQTLLGHLESELRRSGAKEGDDSLPRIFTPASMNVLLNAGEVLAAWASEGITEPVLVLRKELVRLSTRASDAGQTGIAALADALCEAHERVGANLTADVWPVLEDAHEMLVNALDVLAANLDVPSVDACIADLAALGSADSPTPESDPVDAQPHLQQIHESVAGLDLDVEMVEIFFEEAEEIIEATESSLGAWSGGDAGAAAELLRSLHTLKGGARMAGFVGLGEEAHNIETWIEAQSANADHDFFMALRERADLLAEHIAMLRRGETVVHEVPIEDDEEIDDMPAEALPTKQVKPAAVGKAEEESALPSHRPAPKQPAVSQTPEVTSVPAPAPQAAAGGPVDDISELEPEILALFLEEAGELSEILDGALQGWRDEPDNELHVEEVLRALHTLKGGSRMAGLMVLGENVHELETRIIDRRGAGLPATFVTEVQREVDALSVQFDALRGGAGGVAPQVVKAAAPQAIETPPPQAIEAAVPQEVKATAPQPDLAKDVPTAPPGVAKDAPQEMVRVSAGLLDELVGLAGETSIMRGRIQQQINDFSANQHELAGTIERLRQQILRLDSEAQEQVSSRRDAVQRAERAGYEDFDPLEMDRYTQLQELTRILSESASDVSDLCDTFAGRIRDADTLLVQQGRIATELQEGLMRTRMVPFARLLPRLTRLVRQVGRELGKPASLVMEKAEQELDRNVLDRMVAPLEHMLRNAIDHGLEAPEQRVEAGKPAHGTIRLSIDRDGGDIVIRVADDGGGINVDGVRAKAIERGLLDPDAEADDAEVLSFIMSAGFSTAKSVTQLSGRGVGMDVVNSEVRLLGGTISIASELGEGTSFTVRLPFTVSVNRALMVHVGNDLLAIPLEGVRAIIRVSPSQLLTQYAAGPNPGFSYAGRDYSLSYLGEWLGDSRRIVEDVPSVPIIVVRSGDTAHAVHVDAISGSREVVVKSLGAQFAGTGGVSGATIMGDGSVVVILDLPALMRSSRAPQQIESEENLSEEAVEVPAGPLRVLVVDDSVVVRKVTTRLLERRGYRVTVAKDGVEAVALLAEEKPDIMLLDIEMPRMDGFEVAAHVRNESMLTGLPIIMITSRTGEKHRERAKAVGVDRFLGKPFQETRLFAEIEALTA